MHSKLQRAPTALLHYCALAKGTARGWKPSRHFCLSPHPAPPRANIPQILQAFLPHLSQMSLFPPSSAPIPHCLASHQRQPLAICLSQHYLSYLPQTSLLPKHCSPRTLPMASNVYEIKSRLLCLFSFILMSIFSFHFNGPPPFFFWLKKECMLMIQSLENTEKARS